MGERQAEQLRSGDERLLKLLEEPNESLDKLQVKYIQF